MELACPPFSLSSVGAVLMQVSFEEVLFKAMACWNFHAGCLPDCIVSFTEDSFHNFYISVTWNRAFREPGEANPCMIIFLCGNNVRLVISCHG